MIDLVACEPHFLAHAAPVFSALPAELRGCVRVDPSLADAAAGLGFIPEPLPPSLGRPGQRPGPVPLARPGPGPLALVASIGDTKVARRLGYRRFIRMEHGAGQSYGGDRSTNANRNPSYPGGMDNEDAVLFLVPNQHAADRWRRFYPETPVAVVGCPKLDTLPRTEPDKPVVALTWHFPIRICAETQSAFPAYARSLADLAKRFTVIGHQHPRWDAAPGALPPSHFYRRSGIEFVPVFEDVLRRASVLVFDNSSAGFEFAATGRPVVVVNALGYRRSVAHGLRFWDAADVGVQVDEPSRFIAAIERALESRESDVEARERALDTVYAYRTGAAERAATAIAEWAGLAVVA